MKLLLALFMLIFTSTGFSQIKGKVLDSQTGEPLIGALIIGVDTTTTNVDGEFSIRSNGLISVSYIGYETATVNANKAFITVLLTQKSLSISEVVVQAFQSNRALLTVAAPVSVLTKKELNRVENTTLIPLLNAIPGVKLDYYTYGDYRLNIRGGALAQPSVHSSGYRMYWNDIPISSASGGTPLGGLDLNFINSIEIIKGPGSSMYGAGFGGTMLVNTERTTKTGTSINADVLVGGYKTFRSTSGIQSDWGRGNLALQYTHLQSGGYRPMTNTNSNVYNLFGQIYTGNKGTFNYLLNYEKRKMNIAGDLDSTTFKDSPKSVNTIMPTGFGPDKITFGAGYQHRFDDKWNLSLGANYQDNKGEFVLSYPFFAIFDKEPSSGLNSRAVITHKSNIGRNTLKMNAGFEFGAAKNKGISYNGDFNTDTAIITNINEARTNQLLGFLQAEIAIPGDWFITGGISYNNYHYDVKSATNTPDPLAYKTNANGLAPRLSILKKLKTISIYAAAGEGFNPPAAGIFNDFLNFDGSINNDLRASTGWNLEVGSRGSIGEGLFFYDVTFYNLKVKDAIISRLFEISPGVNAERKTNAGSVNQTGVETTAGIHFTKDQKSFWRGSQFRLGYTFNDFLYDDYKTFKTEFDPSFNPVYVPVDYSGKEIPGTIRHAWVAMLDINTKPGFYLNYTLTTNSDTWLTNENTSKADAYHIQNIKIGWRKPLGIDKISLHPYLGINNIGDTLYSSLTAYNSTFGGFFNPGYKRQLYAGVQFNIQLSK